MARGTGDAAQLDLGYANDLKATLGGKLPLGVPPSVHEIGFDNCRPASGLRALRLL